MPLTEKETHDIARKLNSLRPGLLPRPIFYEMARITVIPTLVIVPICRHKNKILVYLKKRDKNDPYFKNKFNIPGAVILSTDKSLPKTIARLIQAELYDVNLISPVTYFDLFFQDTLRGKEICLVYMVEIDYSDNLEGRLYKETELLGQAVIESEIPRIKRALKAFKLSIKESK